MKHAMIIQTPKARRTVDISEDGLTVTKQYFIYDEEQKEFVLSHTSTRQRVTPERAMEDYHRLVAIAFRDLYEGELHIDAVS